ncbi:MAG: hypothetical protein ACT4PZ_14150 [Panacagrimonas sp.]
MKPDRDPHQNVSERIVPNGSESRKPTTGKLATDKQGTSTGAPDPKGRPPVMDDPQLLALAMSMADRLGRAPKIEELIAESGGCQRQRASRVLQKLREQIAARNVRRVIELPAELETEMRGWIDRWKTISAQQLAAEHVRIEERHQAERAADKDLIVELQIALQDTRERLETQSRLTTELLATNRQIEDLSARLRTERDIARVLADDRMNIISQFKA